MPLKIDEIKKMMAEATPGEWKACGASEGKCQCRLLWTVADKENEYVIARTLTEKDDDCTGGEGCDHEQACANLAFIAALPEIAQLAIEQAEEIERLKSMIRDRVSIHNGSGFLRSIQIEGAESTLTIKDNQSNMQNDQEWWKTGEFTEYLNCEISDFETGNCSDEIQVPEYRIEAILAEHRKRVVREIREACCDVCKDALDLKNEKNV